MSKKNLFIHAICLSFLLIPFIGMQLTDTIQWSVLDFVVMGIFCLALALGFNGSVEKSKALGKNKLIWAL